eukprot:1554721-Pyramimonas_sp.AAC.1
MSAGIHVAFPGYEVQRSPQSAQIMQYAYALDCRIRSAVETFDLLHPWINALRNEVSETVRRNCSGIQVAMVFMHTSTEFQFSVKICLANSLFGVFNTDDAVGTTN